MFYAFGKLLSNQTRWKNQQYLQLPKSDNILQLGVAEELFEKRISFGLTGETGTELGFFSNSKRAIIAPYVYENLIYNMQTKAHRYLQVNNPAYNLVEASKIKGLVNKEIQKYIELGYINNGTVDIRAEQDNFVFDGDIMVGDPTALWRVKVNFVQGGI